MISEKQVEAFLDEHNVFAVVGVSRDPRKYGHQVYKDLKSAGYKVYPVNPNAQEVLGDKCYPCLEGLPEKPDVVVTVVLPQVTGQVVKTCKELGIKRVWMQPGSESEEAIRFCKENGLEVVYNKCIMVERRRRK